MSQHEHNQRTMQGKKGMNGGDVSTMSELSSDVSTWDGEQQHSDVLSEESQPMLSLAAVHSTPVCTKCCGAGWVRQPGDLPPWHPAFKSRVECECLIEKRRLRRLNDMLGLCMRFGFQRERTLSTFRAQVHGVQQAAKEAKRLIDLLTGWATKERNDPTRRIEASKEPLPKEWLVLVGPVGTGKSHLAMAVGNAALDADIVTLFAAVPDLLDHLRQAFQPGSTVFYDELFEQLKNAELLILDDLGAEFSSGWADEKLFQLFNYRYNLCLPTIVTLNKQGWDCMDVRLKSRLSDRSLVKTVNLDQAKDYREQQGKAKRT